MSRFRFLKSFIFFHGAVSRGLLFALELCHLFDVDRYGPAILSTFSSLAPPIKSKLARPSFLLAEIDQASSSGREKVFICRRINFYIFYIFYLFFRLSANTAFLSDYYLSINNFPQNMRQIIALINKSLMTNFPIPPL